MMAPFRRRTFRDRDKEAGGAVTISNVPMISGTYGTCLTARDYMGNLSSVILTPAMVRGLHRAMTELRRPPRRGRK